MSDEQKAPRIVVRDRRAFARDGSRREGAEPRSRPEEPAVLGNSGARGAPERPSGREPDAAPASSAGSSPPKEEPRFKQLVSLLFSQAAVLLEQGSAEGGKRGDAGGPEVLACLQTVIGLLEVLDEKTRGRLAGGDARLLSQVLYQLRMAYMERARAPGR